MISYYPILPWPPLVTMYICIEQIDGRMKEARDMRLATCLLWQNMGFIEFEISFSHNAKRQRLELIRCLDRTLANIKVKLATRLCSTA